MRYTEDGINELVKGILQGDRLALSKGITLVESSLDTDREAQHILMEAIMPQTGNAMRIAFTGPPGVGKSSSIEAIGMHYVGQGKKVAVLAVDPSSERTKGSILGDKTRMQQLSRSDKAFIRPSPSGLEPGGIKQSTRSSMLLCEAAGFDIVIVETVGAGQNEFYAHYIVDLMILLLPTNAGDEVQGIKRGIMEMAHIYLINKADGSNLPKAQLLKKELETLLPYLSKETHDQAPDVIVFSALEGIGVDQLASCIEKRYKLLNDTGRLQALRDEQAKRWLDDWLVYRFLEKMKKHSQSSSIQNYRQMMTAKVYPGRWIDSILDDIFIQN